MSKSLRGLRGSNFGISANNSVPPIPDVDGKFTPEIPKYLVEEGDKFDYVAKIYNHSDVTDEEGVKIQQKLIDAVKVKDYESIPKYNLDFAKYFYARGKYSDALNYVSMGLNLVNDTKTELYSELRGMRGVLYSHSLKPFGDRQIEEDLDAALNVKKRDPLFLRKKAVLSDHQKQYLSSSRLFEKAFGATEKVELRNVDEV